MSNSSSLDPSSTVTTHPRILIQHDWYDHIKSETLPVDIWLEYKSGSESISRIVQNVHGVCSINPLENKEATNYKTSANDNFHPSPIDRNQHQLRIKIRDAEFSHTFQGPTKSFSTSGKKDDDDEKKDLDPLINVPELPKNRTQQTNPSVYPHWFDISSGGVGLTALSNGKITIWDIENGDVRRKLNGHIEDVYISRFFPSDFAVVSGGADMRVKIWSLDNDNNQINDTTLIGHHSRINDVLPLDRQRVLSASNDGSVILWDITKSKQINKIAELENNSINSISLTSSSLLACACNDGSIRFYDLNNIDSKKVIHEIKIGSPVSTICHLAENNQLGYGTEQSIVGVCDLKQLNDAYIRSWKEQRGKITCVIPNRDKHGLLVTTSDGSCFECDQTILKPMTNIIEIHVCDYTGADDSILNGKIFNNQIYTICRDGFVRAYAHRI